MKKIYASTKNTEFTFEGELFAASSDQMNSADQTFVPVETTDKKIVMLDDRNELKAGRVYTIHRCTEDALIVLNGDNEITVSLESAYLLNPKPVASTAFIVYDGNDDLNMLTLVFGVATSREDAERIQSKHSNSKICQLPVNTDHVVVLGGEGTD